MYRTHSTSGGDCWRSAVALQNCWRRVDTSCCHKILLKKRASTTRCRCHLAAFCCAPSKGWSCAPCHPRPRRVATAPTRMSRTQLVALLQRCPLAAKQCCSISAPPRCSLWLRMDPLFTCTFLEKVSSNAVCSTQSERILSHFLPIRQGFKCWMFRLRAPIY